MISIVERNLRKRNGTLRAAALFIALSIVICPQVAGAITLLDLHVDSPFDPAPTDGRIWNHYTLDDAFDEVQVELQNEYANPTGIQFQHRKPPSVGYAGAQNQPIYSPYAPSGIDLFPFGHNLTWQTEGYVLELTGLIPGKQYDMWVLTWAYEESFSPSRAIDVVGAGDWTRIETPSDVFLAINGVEGSSANTFDSYARRFQAAPNGTLQLISAEGDFVGVYGFAIERVPEPATFVLVIMAALCTINVRVRRR